MANNTRRDRYADRETNEFFNENPSRKYGRSSQTHESILQAEAEETWDSLSPAEVYQLTREIPARPRPPIPFKLATQHSQYHRAGSDFYAKLWGK